MVLIGDHWTGLERAGWSGQNAAVLTVSLAVFPPLGGLLTELGGWRLSFAPYARRAGHRRAHLAPARRRPPGRRRDLREQLSGAGEAVRHRDVLGSISIGFVIFMLIFGLFLTALPVHLEREFGLGAGQRGPGHRRPGHHVDDRRPPPRAGCGPAFGVVRLLCGASVLFTDRLRRDRACADRSRCSSVGALLYGLGEGVFIPTLQDVVAGSASIAAAGRRGGGVGGRGASRPDRRTRSLASARLRRGRHLRPRSSSAAALAAGLVVFEAVGRFGASGPCARA